MNPDNPSGNFINKQGLSDLIVWARENTVKLIVDESFVDFADHGEETTLMNNDILERNPHLYVMKSISKSYGVPGLRLGVLATSDKDLIAFMRKDVGIWNINSFAEFYLQIFGKYEKDYARSCEKFQEERALFFSELCRITFLRVIPSQANYFLCEIIDKYTSYELTLKLLNDHNIFIKDCSSKKGFCKDKHYVRIAIRDRKDNSYLVKVLRNL